jgi:hypothetical protein
MLSDNQDANATLPNQQIIKSSEHNGRQIVCEVQAKKKREGRGGGAATTTKKKAQMKI